MKKYIRTKEGNIYQRFFIDKSIRGVGGGGCCDQNLNPIGETIVKESDTIEELCDFALSEWFDGWWETYNLNSEEKVKKHLFLKLTVKGDCSSLKYGIKTDKGLIYVAKMNEKGELELL